MAKQIFIGNLVRDAEAVSKEIGGEQRNFGAFTVALNGGNKDSTTMYVDGFCNEKLTQYLRKGQQIVVAADSIQYKIEDYKAKDGSDKTAVRFSFERPEIELGDVVYVTARGRLAAKVEELEGKGFAAPRILSNTGKKGEDTPPVATSFIIGDKLLAAFEKADVDLSAGREVTVQGKAVVRAYNTKEGEARAEIRMGNAALTLGRTKAEKSEAPAAAATADDMDDDIPF